VLILNRASYAHVYRRREVSHAADRNSRLG
jgi:hypothetical protein